MSILLQWKQKFYYHRGFMMNLRKNILFCLVFSVSCVPASAMEKYKPKSEKKYAKKVQITREQFDRMFPHKTSMKFLPFSDDQASLFEHHKGAIEKVLKEKARLFASGVTQGFLNFRQEFRDTIIHEDVDGIPVEFHFYVQDGRVWTRAYAFYASETNHVMHEENLESLPFALLDGRYVSRYTSQVDTPTLKERVLEVVRKATLESQTIQDNFSERYSIRAIPPQLPNHPKPYVTIQIRSSERTDCAEYLLKITHMPNS
jgi:hypothetical protein